MSISKNFALTCTLALALLWSAVAEAQSATAAIPNLPSALVTRINKTTGAVEMQDGTGQWVSIGTINPSAHNLALSGSIDLTTLPIAGSASARHTAANSLAAIPMDGTVLTPSISSCPTANCNPIPSQSSMAAIWLEGQTQLGTEAEALMNLGWTVKTGAGNAQKPAVYIGVVQAQGAGSAWGINLDIVRGGVPGGKNSTPGHTGSSDPSVIGHIIGLHDSTINTEDDFSNWDQDGLLGQGPFTVNIYLHAASIYAGTADIYADCDSISPRKSNYCWHVGIGFYGNQTVQDSTFVDYTTSYQSVFITNNHNIAINGADQYANFNYAETWNPGAPICLNKIKGCLKYDTGAASLIYAPAGNSAPAAISLKDNGAINATSIVTSGTSSIGGSLSVGGQLTATGQITGSNLRATFTYTPPSSSSACTTGDMAWDGTYEYRCVGTNAWQRTARSTF